MQDGCGLAANPLDITSRGVRNAAFNCMVAHVYKVPLRVNHKVATRITCIAAGLKCKVVAQQKKKTAKLINSPLFTTSETSHGWRRKFNYGYPTKHQQLIKCARKFVPFRASGLWLEACCNCRKDSRYTAGVVSLLERVIK